MTTTAAQLRWHRLRAGTYQATIGAGELDRFVAESVPGEAGAAYGATTRWYLTYPGACVADSVGDTLREVKSYAEAWMQAEGAAR